MPGTPGYEVFKDPNTNRIKVADLPSQVLLRTPAGKMNPADLPADYASTWRNPVANSSQLPLTGNNPGDVRVALLDGSLWVNQYGDATWVQLQGGGGGGAPPPPVPQTLATNTAATTISVLTFAKASYSGCLVDYELNRGTTAARIGRLKVLLTPDKTSVLVSDSGVETSVDPGVTFTAVINGTNVEVKWATDNSIAASASATFVSQKFA